MLQRFLLLLILSAAAVAQSPFALHRETYQISGTVVNALSSQPLPRVEIAIAVAGEGNAFKTLLTDEQGLFSFTGLSAGKYALSAQKRGFPHQGYEQHEDYWTGIAIGPNQATDAIVFRLFPSASISGIVSDHQNETVPGADMLLFRRGVTNGRRATLLAQQTQTDDRGHYLFSHLLPGNYFVVVSAMPWFSSQYPHRNAGEFYYDSPPSSPTSEHSPLDMAYPITFYPSVTESSSAAPLALGPGDRVSADILLTAIPSLHATIHPPSGRMLAYTDLTCNLFGTFALHLHTRLDHRPSGELAVDGLTSGQYKITTQWRDSSGNSTGSSQFIDITGDMEIDPSRGNFGKVDGGVTIDGKPAPPGILVRLINAASEEGLNTQTIPGGKFEFKETIEPGTYNVIAFPSRDSAIDHLSATGAETAGLDLIIHKPGDVHLNINVSPSVSQIDGLAVKDGKPASQTMVLLIPENLEHTIPNVRRDQSDSDGTFVLYSVPPGKYTVVALQDKWDLEWTDLNAIGPYLKHGESLQVGPNQKYKIKVNVQ